MDQIRIRPGITGILAIALLVLLAALFTFYPDFFLLNKNNSVSDGLPWVGFVFLFIAILLFSQFKSVTISNGKIYILYYLSRKKITAELNMISRVTFGTTKMEHGSAIHTQAYNKTISILFKDKQNTLVRIHGGFHTNLEAIEKFIKTNYPGVNW